MIVEDLVEFTTRHQVYLERVKSGEVKKADDLFVRLIAELSRILFRLRLSDLGTLPKIRAAKLLKDVEKLHTDEYQKHLVAFAASLRELAEEEREFELESLNEATIDELEPDDGGDEAIAALWPTVQEQPMSATGKLLAAYLALWMAQEVARATDLVRKAIAEGWSPNDLLYAFRGTAEKHFDDGLIASARRNTNTTIRTAMQHVSSAARWATMRSIVLRPRSTPRTGEDDAVQVNTEGVVTRIPRSARETARLAGVKVGDRVALLGYRWISILDSKTSQVCRSLDGQVFKFGQGPIPPAHPNCRSSIIAELLGRWKKRDKTGRFTKDDRARPSSDGDISVRTTYYEWLKTQSAEFQDDVLGPTRGKLFRKGGLSAEAFARLNLDRNFEPMTLDEMRRRAPLVFKRAGI